MSIAPAPAQAAPPLASRDFRRLWIGQAICQDGDGITGLLLFVVVHHLTGSAAALGTLAVLTSFPQLLLGLHAGVLADRWPRRWVLVTSDLLRGTLVLGFLLTLDRSRI